jgi:hypothetical protein
VTFIDHKIQCFLNVPTSYISYVLEYVHSLCWSTVCARLSDHHLSRLRRRVIFCTECRSQVELAVSTHDCLLSSIEFLIVILLSFLNNDVANRKTPKSESRKVEIYNRDDVRYCIIRSWNQTSESRKVGKSDSRKITIEGVFRR